ncbi:XRE family transcriptional regulator [Nesterenkonia sp. AN1]|uniref:helix-turn-helix domain-containing protein n=1 Tax=unclassified Nesterenkonia TaxID=2629769 RepID=UPI00044627AA|nr:MULTISPECIES: helix-turn-helix transcriptional regulator [unclassified Nesterenkonia]EXF24269.1 XRE family transcriptional regulator [Nesterenkonia sp. AN1]MBO0596371.1 helix-turn-helix transcriptional regulator [Nesterenkonia sp. E16_10]MBO0597401.1 helix-turn-helix transcriptional regulator [Nesterenkonia sp. E16_7]
MVNDKEIGSLARAAVREIRAHMARQQPPMTGRDLADRTGLSQNYVARRLREDISLTLNDMEVISSALGLDPGRLFANAVESAKADEADRIRRTAE